MSAGHLLLLAQTEVHKYLDIEPLFSLNEAWQWLILFAVIVGFIAFVVATYLFDSVELSRGTTVLLTTLRVLALGGLLVYLLNPVIRSERRIVKNSRVPVIVDTSLSMGLRDTNSPSAPTAPSRIEQIVTELQHGTLIPELRQQHDLVVYRFDQTSRPTEVASYSRLAPDVDRESREAMPAERAAALQQSRSLARGAAILGGLSAAFLLVFLVTTWRSHRIAPWMLTTSVLLLAASVIVLAVSDLRSPDADLRYILGLQSDPTGNGTAGEGDEGSADPTRDDRPAEDDDNQPELPVDWQTELLPRGTETRLGDALRYVINKERGGPIAGIVLMTDGQSNEGIEYGAAVSLASDAQIPIYTVGLGSIHRPANVRVVDMQAPRRVYPGDQFVINGFLQSFGIPDGKPLRVSLVSTAADDPDQIERYEEQVEVPVAADGKEIPLQFKIEPDEDRGRRIFKLRVVPPAEDHDGRDNELTATVDVVERKNKVLLIAGGPNRDFRFLRSQMYRDDDTELFVWLQTAEPNSAYAVGRETLIHSFPEDEEELFDFDCMIAFDADWRLLSDQQVELLERWVSEKAGGMVVVAGPVYTPLWTSRPRGDERIDTLRALYPVSFFSQGSATIRIGRFGGEESFPLAFSRDGRSADFLRLSDEEDSTEGMWENFEVFGYYAVNRPKPGATVYARFSDPATASGPNDELPIYLAGHFYGAGRVFFQASSEIWRIRSLDDKFFERYYTKLIRWASQGRLLRDSPRGVLLVDKDRCLLGDHVEVRAILTDARHRPLDEPEVRAVLVQPDSTRLPITLKRLQEGARAGTFVARFTALQEGDYSVVLALPEYELSVPLTRDVRVRLPDKEIERPQRHDVLLADIARRTAGAYFIGLDAAMQADPGSESLPQKIEPQDQITYLPGTPDQRFTTKLMGWLLVTICGALSLEWLVRRSYKLA